MMNKRMMQRDITNNNNKKNNTQKMQKMTLTTQPRCKIIHEDHPKSMPNNFVMY